MKPLTQTQASVLAGVQRHGAWAKHGEGAGWVWGNNAITERACEALVKRGFLKKQETGHPGSFRYTPV